MQITTNKRTWFILIGSILIIIVLVMYPLQGFSSSTNIITHQIDIIAGNSKCFYEQIPNERDYTVTITEFNHTITNHNGGIIHEGISISIHNELGGVEIQTPIEIPAGQTFSFYICYNTDIRLKPDTYNMRTNFITEETEDPTEESPPAVSISKPEGNSLYVFNRKIHSNFCCKTMIIGPIDIIVEAIDESGIDYVEFYINDNQVENITEESSDSLYTYQWSNFAFGCYTIRIDAYDSLGNSDSESISVFKFL